MWPLRISVLVIVWWICSAQAEVFFLLCGVVSVWAATYLAGRFHCWDGPALADAPLKLLRYIPWILKEIALSAWEVTRLIWQPRPRISPRLFRIKSALVHDLALTTYGHSITLTPGTLTVAIEPPYLTVHALKRSSEKALLEGGMERQIRHLFEVKP